MVRRKRSVLCGKEEGEWLGNLLLRTKMRGILNRNLISWDAILPNFPPNFLLWAPNFFYPYFVAYLETIFRIHGNM